jgi:hypothetical protein
MRRAPWIQLTILAALCGLPFMVAMAAIGVGDTAQGNSTSPFIAGDVTIIGVPLVVAWIAYAAARYWDVSRLRALAVAAFVPPAMLVAAVAALWLLVSLS